MLKFKPSCCICSNDSGGMFAWRISLASLWHHTQYFLLFLFTIKVTNFWPDRTEKTNSKFKAILTAHFCILQSVLLAHKAVKMLRSTISNLPFLDGADDMFATTNKSHFKLVDASVKSKRDVVLQPVSPLFQWEDQKYLAKYQRETALSFPSHPAPPVIEPNLTHFNLHSEDRCGDYETSQSELKPLPKCAAKIIRPTTAVRTSLLEDKYPEPTYRSSYVKHKVSRIFRAKQSAKTGKYCTLTCSTDI